MESFYIVSGRKLMGFDSSMLVEQFETKAKANKVEQASRLQLLPNPFLDFVTRDGGKGDAADSLPTIKGLG